MSVEMYEDTTSYLRCQVAAVWLARRRYLRLLTKSVSLDPIKVKTQHRTEDTLLHRATIDQLFSKVSHTPLKAPILSMVERMDLSARNRLTLGVLHYPPGTETPIHFDARPAQSRAKDGFLTIAGGGLVREFDADGASPDGNVFYEDQVEEIQSLPVSTCDLTIVHHQGYTIHQAIAGSRGRTALNVLAE